MKKQSALWGGRFKQSTNEEVQHFTESVSFDQRLYRHDIQGSLAHAAMLHKIGILTAQELKAIQKGLQNILKKIEAGQFEWKEKLEDVHMNIESDLTRQTPAGAHLHTGRSRNDQIVTDMRLWLKDQILLDIQAIRALQKALLTWAKRDQEVLIPGYTHLQRAQPIYLAHHLLAYMEMLERDAGRFKDAFNRMDECPLGSGALAGSTLPLDRQMTARLLGFARITQNSLDAVSDRDFIIEYAAASALLAVHLSRLGEDLILWSTSEWKFIVIGDAFTTGSSLMPQKKNPDVAELIRGKSGRVIGNLMSLLTMMKGLPMSLNRDMQEDKERFFDTANTVQACLRMMTLMLGDIAVCEDRWTAAVSDPLLLATDVADLFVESGIPFRHAHEIVGKAVALSEQRGIPLNKISLAEWRQIDSKVPTEVNQVFDLKRAMKKRRMIGAPGTDPVNKRLRYWTQKLKAKKA